MIPAPILRHRDRACASCATPCALRDAHDDPCAVCPLTPPAWPQWDCRPGAETQASVPLGDKIAAEIHTHVIDRVRKRAPAVATALEQCGGCKADRRALNGGGLLPGERPPVIV